MTMPAIRSDWPWIKLTSLSHPDRVCSQPVPINDIEFVEWSQKKPNKIHKFNIIENKWNEWIEIPDPDHIKSKFIGAVMFDTNGSKLYFHSQYHFIEWNIKHKTYHIFDTVYCGALRQGVVINGKCHIIGGLINNKHLIWNNKQKTFDIQHEFEDFNRILCHRLIHLKSKKILLFLGGGNENGLINAIYSFNLDTSKWSKLPQILPNKMCDFGCIKSRNDQYILIFGGWTDEGKTDKIHILNTKTMRFNESTIICPKKERFGAINMNNSKREQLLNCGYIRNLWNSPQFNNIMYPPFYLVEIIGNYFSLEIIYLLDKQQGGLWKINIDQIISNCSK